MNACLQPEPPSIVPMTVSDLDAVMLIENEVYEFPWTRGNMIDSLAAGYFAYTLRDVGAEILGYYVAMAGVDEMHLLNLSVASPVQGRGHGRRLLDHLVALGLDRGALLLWLEVRMSNERAAQLYRRYGFREIGVRRGYYPAAFGRREDAQVMSLTLDGDPHAL